MRHFFPTLEEGAVEAKLPAFGLGTSPKLVKGRFSAAPRVWLAAQTVWGKKAAYAVRTGGEGGGGGAGIGFSALVACGARSAGLQPARPGTRWLPLEHSRHLLQRGKVEGSSGVLRQCWTPQLLGAWCRRHQPQPCVAGWGCEAQASASIAAKINAKQLMEAKLCLQSPCYVRL